MLCLRACSQQSWQGEVERGRLPGFPEEAVEPSQHGRTALARPEVCFALSAALALGGCITKHVVIHNTDSKAPQGLI